MWAGDELGPDHTKCRLKEYEPLRATWGCDAPAEDPVFEVACASCSGDPKCKECGGTGIKHIHRCPWALLNTDPRLGMEIEQVFRAYVIFAERSTPPVAGGWLDQTACFAKAVDIIDEERGRYLSMAEEDREAERRAAERRYEEAIRSGRH